MLNFFILQILAKQNPEIVKFLEIFDKVKQLVSLYEHIHASYHLNFRNFQITISGSQISDLTDHVLKLKDQITVFIYISSFILLTFK